MPLKLITSILKSTALLLDSTTSDGLYLLFEFQTRMKPNFIITLSNVTSSIASLMDLSGITYFIKTRKHA